MGKENVGKIWNFHNKFLSLHQKGRTMDKEVSRTICNYFKTQPVEKAWVFGSFSRGEERPDSDVDIMITLIPGTRMGLKFFAIMDSYKGGYPLQTESVAVHTVIS